MDTCYILLSSNLNDEYFEMVDPDEIKKLNNYNKIYDKIINIKDLQFSNNHLDGGELYVSPKIINNQYPALVIPNV
jgi:hypothetical protein